MELKKENILKVQRERGRGNLNLHAQSKLGNHEWVFPAKPGNKEYEIVLEWLKDGNTILDPPLKDARKNREDFVYTKHPECHLPDNESLAIWRYMNFPKFLSLLDKSALFFSRAINIIKYDDPFEGSFTESSITMFDALSRHIKENYPKKDNADMFNKLKIGHQVFKRLFETQVLINCWIMKEYEDSSMWTKFGGQDNISVVIKSDLNRLKRCFGRYSDYEIFISKISYIDYEKDSIKERSEITPFLYKRKLFDGEREVRCFLVDDGDISLFPDEEPMPVTALNEGLSLNPGVNIPVDLDILIDKIYLSDKSSEWARAMIYSLFSKLSLPPKEILISTIHDKPNY